MTIVTTVQPDSSQYTQIPPSPPFQLHNIKVVINMFGVLWPLVCTLMALYLHPLMLWVTKQWCHIWCLLIVHTLHKWPIHIVYLLHSPCYIPMVLHLFPTLFTSPQWPLLTLPKQLVKSQLNLWKQSLLGASKTIETVQTVPTGKAGPARTLVSIQRTGESKAKQTSEKPRHTGCYHNRKMTSRLSRRNGYDIFLQTSHMWNPLFSDS